MKNFDYIIVTDSNEWVSTGRQETEEQLQSTIEQLKTDYPDNKLIIYKAEIMEEFNV